MKRAAAPKQASQTDSSRRTEPAAGLRGIALAPPDYGTDLVDRLSAGDGPTGFDSSRLNGGRRVRQQKILFDDISNSPRVVQQTALMDQIANGPRVLQQKALSDSVRNSPRVMAQRQRESSPGSPAPRAAGEPEPNNTSLPDALKSGVESLSGMSLDNVKVHYNSSRPAQLDALAYAQGSDIHVAPGQERHLPHEAWHVVQQAQGRVKPTMQLKDAVPVNDDAGLEREADVMGAKALQQAQGRVKPTMQTKDGGSVDGLPKAAVGLSQASKSGMDQSCVASLPSNRIATVQRRVGRADGVAAMNADQMEKWLTSQGQWEGISVKVAGVIDEMMKSHHQWTYGGFSSYLLVQDAKALVDVHYRQGVIHGDLKGVENKADFHVDPGDGRGLRAERRSSRSYLRCLERPWATRD